MSTRCLQFRSSVQQLLRCPSPTPKSYTIIRRNYAQQAVSEDQFRTRGKLLKPSYQPSSIFGLVKPTSDEALQKPLKGSTAAKLPREEEKSKVPLTEDEKQVC